MLKERKSLQLGSLLEQSVYPCELCITVLSAHIPLMMSFNFRIWKYIRISPTVWIVSGFLSVLPYYYFQLPYGVFLQHSHGPENKCISLGISSLVWPVGSNTDKSNVLWATLRYPCQLWKQKQRAWFSFLTCLATSNCGGCCKQVMTASHRKREPLC